jgi:MoaA/NifB/PqqE/SkfB family radical SAM enzyme
MKAIIKSRVNIENHVSLEEAVPLKVPFVLIVDPSNICNLRCKFCPSGNPELIKSTGRYQGFLGLDLFKKIIDDLHEFEVPIKTLRLYKEGEPLLNKDFANMVKYAKDSNMVNRIDTTTNAVSLNPAFNKSIIKAGINQINISVNGVSEEHIYNFTKTKINFKKYVENIKDLYENRDGCEISIKAIKENLTEDEQKKFFDIFGNIADRIYIETLSPVWPDFVFSDDLKVEYNVGHYGQKIVKKNVCPFIFYTMVINSSGKSSLCVNDWKNELIVGDISFQSVKEVWLGEKMNAHRICHLKGNRKRNKFCGICNAITYATFDNLDSRAKEILRRFET